MRRIQAQAAMSRRAKMRHAPNQQTTATAVFGNFEPYQIYLLSILIVAKAELGYTSNAKS